MKPYLAKTPGIIRRIWPDYTWQIANEKKEIFLTFDDGPHPVITPWVMDILEQFQAKATFFCVGDNIRKYPNIFQEVSDKGHSIGNHTFNHLNGWKTNTKNYLENIERTEDEIRSVNSSFNLKNRKKLFRPPYGKIRSSSAKILLKEGYRIIMWDVLSGDFDIGLGNEKCLQNVIQNTKEGSIVVFHDHEKAFKKLQFVLPKVLEFYSKKEYAFKAI